MKLNKVPNFQKLFFFQFFFEKFDPNDLIGPVDYSTSRNILRTQ